VALYCQSGKLTYAASELGLDPRTLGRWSKTDWWADWEASITEQLSAEAVNQYRGIVDAANTQLADRLKYGERVKRKTRRGFKWVREPIIARELSQIANTAHQQLRISEGKSTNIIENKSLAELAAVFKAIAADQHGRIIDVTPESRAIESNS
jgi:hypothetical protein